MAQNSEIKASVDRSEANSRWTALIDNDTNKYNIHVSSCCSIVGNINRYYMYRIRSIRRRSRLVAALE